MKQVTVVNRIIGPNQPIFIIAEIGGNYETIEQAKKMIDYTKDAGADAIKLQTYFADKIAQPQSRFEVKGLGEIDQYQVCKKFEVNKESHQQIFDYARENGMIIFSTPSCRETTDFLEELGTDAYKTGADEITNIPLLKYIARKGKPIFMSTGISTMTEISMAIEAIKEEGNKDILLFQTTSIYPNDPKDANLRVMEMYKLAFSVPVGFSDHTADIYTPIAAAAIGANMIEKHFCLSRNDPGTDTFFALEPNEFREMCKGIRIAEAALGSAEKKILDGEKKTAKGFRKSFIAWRDIKKGEVLTENNTIVKRPGKGIWPQHYEAILGAKVNKDIAKDDFIRWKDITERT
ncbi:hypothetical protein HON71_00595 [Candidatus Woesearchaeota archaeon]|jgi:N,N'-diacetyllegionaminate synthase|nr:hypothetical protein [Candidatus Woesearchaeota archaeon]MBT5342936.1 hypothetical protein [Candidatus Woesearchaeota archaeon]